MFISTFIHIQDKSQYKALTTFSIHFISSPNLHQNTLNVRNELFNVLTVTQRVKETFR
jgi:hypothetical protein